MCMSNSSRVNVVMESSEGGSEAKYGRRGGTVIHGGWLGGTWHHRDSMHVLKIFGTIQSIFSSVQSFWTPPNWCHVVHQGTSSTLQKVFDKNPIVRKRFYLIFNGQISNWKKMPVRLTNPIVKKHMSWPEYWERESNPIPGSSIWVVADSDGWLPVSPGRGAGVSRNSHVSHLLPQWPMWVHMSQRPEAQKP